MSRIADTFDKRAAEVKKAVVVLGTDTPREGLLDDKAIKENILLDMKEAVNQMDSLRKGSQDRRSVDIDLNQFAKAKYGFADADSLYMALGVDPSFHTISSLSAMSDMPEGYRWLIPEITREAIRLGLRRNPMYADLIASEESVSQPSLIMPSINMSAAMPSNLSEMQTIPTGTLSFGERTVKLRRVGTGLKVSDQVSKYVSLNILGLYLQDVGVQLGLGLDSLAMDCLINGDQADASMAAPTIGVANTSAGVVYRDILRVWLRMGRLGKLPTGILSNENMALTIMELAEFKGANYNNTKAVLNVKTPMPQAADYFVHGGLMSGNKIGIVAKSSSLLKLTSQALTVESERIVEKGLSATYATIETGFAKLFRDAFVILDGDLAYSSYAFPTWMNVDAAEAVTFQ